MSEIEIMLSMSKKIFMIAGPNGAGKTTTAGPLMQGGKVIYEFINSDEIARGLAPMHPESVSLAASKLMLKRLKELLEAGKSFAFETTASGTNYIKYLKEAKSDGYEVQLLFLWLSSPDLAVKRVTQRVAQGGHSVPEETIRRRYQLGLKNLIKHYLPLSDSAIIINGSTSEVNKIIAVKNKKDGLVIENHLIWKKIEGTINVAQA